MDWAIIFFWFFLLQMVFAWLPWFIIIMIVAGKQFKTKEIKHKFDILVEFINKNNLNDQVKEYIKEKGAAENGSKV